jgi:hypothetical protein
MAKNVTTSTPPPDFAAVYIDGGWRKVERVFGASTKRIYQWLARFPDIETERRAELRRQGKSARGAKS